MRRSEIGLLGHCGVRPMAGYQPTRLEMWVRFLHAAPHMIIQLRGTNGSGKSTIVRRVMERFIMNPSKIVGRRQPIGYFSTDPNKPPLFVPGHYETDCGGCDTIASLDTVYEQVTNAHVAGYNVLYEGIMASGEYRRCVDLFKQVPEMIVLALDVPLEQCVADILERRAQSGRNYKPFNKERTKRRTREVRSMMEYLRINKVPNRWVNRDEALQICLQELGAI